MKDYGLDNILCPFFNYKVCCIFNVHIYPKHYFKAHFVCVFGCGIGLVLGAGKPHSCTYTNTTQKVNIRLRYLKGEEREWGLIPFLCDAGVSWVVVGPPNKQNPFPLWWWWWKQLRSRTKQPSQSTAIFLNFWSFPIARKFLFLVPPTISSFDSCFVRPPSQKKGWGNPTQAQPIFLRQSTFFSMMARWVFTKNMILFDT